LLTSKLLYFDGQSVQTRLVEHNFRGLAWSNRDEALLLVGNGGRILNVQGEKDVSIDSGTNHNLRAVAVNDSDGMAIVVGNGGTALLIDEKKQVSKIVVPTFENLRAVAWHREGHVALLAGNNGALFEYSRHGVKIIDAGRANLRDVSWRPKSNTALITSNCFAKEFVPSPNLFKYDSETKSVTPINEGQVDLIGADWKQNGELAVVVGYDVVWHSGFIGTFDGESVSPIEFENKNVYPTAAAWKPSANMAAIVTATAQTGIGKGTLFLWDEGTVKSVFSDPEFYFSDAAWTGNGIQFAALASTEARAFNS
jgi:hypothetical protein